MSSTSGRKTLKIFLPLLIASFFSMGNEKCAKQPAATERVLRMDIELESLAARPIRTPEGEVIDFPFALNTLFYRHVMSNEHFVIIGPVPSPQSMSYPMSMASEFSGVDGFSGKAVDTGPRDTSSAQSSLLEPGPTQSDVLLAEKFGFLDSLSPPHESTGFATKAIGTSSADMPSCLYDSPQASLGGEMISFAATWGVGLGIGYSRGGGSLPWGGPGGHVEFSQSKLELGFRTIDPLTLETQKIAEAVSHQEKIKLGIELGTGIPVGLNFFFKEEISKVIRNGLEKALDSMVKAYQGGEGKESQWNKAWVSRVVYAPRVSDGDTHIAIRAGERANVVKGDRFIISNMDYEWTGAPCYSRLRYKISHRHPVAEVEVIQTGDNLSVAAVTKNLSDELILPGAQVKILELKKDAPSDGGR